jgi:hypothetical protein
MAPTTQGLSVSSRLASLLFLLRLFLLLLLLLLPLLLSAGVWTQDFILARQVSVHDRLALGQWWGRIFSTFSTHRKHPAQNSCSALGGQEGQSPRGTERKRESERERYWDKIPPTTSPVIFFHQLDPTFHNFHHFSITLSNYKSTDQVRALMSQSLPQALSAGKQALNTGAFGGHFRFKQQHHLIIKHVLVTHVQLLRWTKNRL